ncbi:MAG: hypothetical protein ABJF88_11570 [Rhodothermales bacterium]
MPTVSKFILPILLSAVLLGCDYFDSDAEVPAVIAAFVAGHDLPDPQPVRVFDLAAGDGEDIDLFTVSYGPPMDCPSGCFYATAHGLRRGEAVGWLVPDLPGRSPFVAYDFGEADAALYTAELFARFEAVDAWAYRYAFLPVLARDPDVPRDVLSRVARGLYDYIHSGLGWALLENEAVVADEGLLTLLAELPVFDDGYDPYATVRERARELLEALDGGEV